MTLLLTFHGELRWILVLVAASVALRSLFGWLRGADFTALDRVSMALLTAVLDLNLLLGLILLFLLPGGLQAYRLEHALTMLLAVGASHSWAAWRNSPDASRKFRNNFLVALIVLGLVVLGVFRLRGGWLF